MCAHYDVKVISNVEYASSNGAVFYRYEEHGPTYVQRKCP